MTIGAHDEGAPPRVAMMNGPLLLRAFEHQQRIHAHVEPRRA
jgi:hypothetical protein